MAAGSVPSKSAGWPSTVGLAICDCSWKEAQPSQPGLCKGLIYVCKSLAASDAERAIILVQALTDPTCHMEQNRHSTKLGASEAFRWAITHPAERAAEGICGTGWSVPFHLYCFTWDLRCIQDTATDMPGISLILLGWLKLTYALLFFSFDFYRTYTRHNTWKMMGSYNYWGMHSTEGIAGFCLSVCFYSEWNYFTYENLMSQGYRNAEPIKTVLLQRA